MASKASANVVEFGPQITVHNSTGNQSSVLLCWAIVNTERTSRPLGAENERETPHAR
jgi:hypothetical protein